MFRDLGRSGVTTGGWLGRSLSGVDFFDRSLDRANALFVLCSTGGNPVLGAGDLDDKVVDPGVLSRTDPTIWTFSMEASGMRSLVVGVFVKGGEWIEGHVLCESKPVLDAMVSQFTINRREICKDRTVPSVVYIPGIYNKKRQPSSHTNFCQ